MKKEKEEKKLVHWTVCLSCHGLGKKNKGPRKKAKVTKPISTHSAQVDGHSASYLHTCSTCGGSGIIPAPFPPPPATAYPHVAIIGGGIGGMALAVACLHRGIPFTLFERDENLVARSQGYGLTLQQASKVMKDFGIVTLEEQVVSTKHVVHQADGKVLGSWGLRRWQPLGPNKSPKKNNIHIARQSLRLALFNQLGPHPRVQWGHQLLDCTPLTADEIELTFQVHGAIKKEKANLVVGADGIRSSVRRLSMGDEVTPLHYLGCMVILGICPLSAVKDLTTSPLLDSTTVFQTANGQERIYMMPYTHDSIMWQLSFPIEEEEAIALSRLGSEALHAEAFRRTPWHDPIPQIVQSTLPAQISGYPVYDRELLTPENWKEQHAITLLGDAAHPMSPFKGQGANQALLDALLLARMITKGCTTTQWRENGLRTSVLIDFETAMFTRSAEKVKGSAQAAQLLHSDLVLAECDQPRGSVVKSKKHV